MLDIGTVEKGMFNEAKSAWLAVNEEMRASFYPTFEDLCIEYDLKSIMPGFAAVIWGEIQGDEKCLSVDIRAAENISEPFDSMLTNDLSYEEFEKVFVTLCLKRVISEKLKESFGEFKPIRKDDIVAESVTIEIKFDENK